MCSNDFGIVAIFTLADKRIPSVCLKHLILVAREGYFPKLTLNYVKINNNIQVKIWLTSFSSEQRKFSVSFVPQFLCTKALAFFHKCNFLSASCFVFHCLNFIGSKLQFPNL